MYRNPVHGYGEKKLKKKKYITAVCIMLCALFGTGAFLFLQKGCKEASAVKPEITGVKDFVYVQGEEFPDLKEGIKASSTVEEVTVDLSQVNLAEEGEYDVIYHYTDSSGGQHEQKAVCTVTGPPDAVREQEEVTADHTDPGAQIRAAGSVRTGDAEKIFGYMISCIISLAVIIITIIYRWRGNGKL